MWHILVGEAHAMSPGGGGGEPSQMFVQLLPFVAIFAIFYFLVIRPQQRRTRAHRELVGNLRKGDEIWTDSGIRGTIQRVGEDTITLEVSPKVTMKIQRGRVADVIKSSRSKNDDDSDDDAKPSKTEDNPPTPPKKDTAD